MKQLSLTPMLTGLLLVLTACPGPSAGVSGERGSVQLKNWPSGTTATVTFVNLVNSAAVLEAEVTAEGGLEYRLPTLANTDLKPVGQLLASGCTANPTTANLAPVKAIGKTDGGADFYPFAIDFPLDAPRLRVGDELLNYIDSFDVGWYYSDQDVTITCSGWSEALKFKKGWNLSVTKITDAEEGVVKAVQQSSPSSLSSAFSFYAEFGASSPVLSFNFEPQGSTAMLNLEYRAKAARLLGR
ncbi:hypothetical protein [Calidithermus timidus]|jgi:hypothetical protein|uniref:hypothetical protein n=1 Tax=Calidithermus timidus TaxID=307124 RepID=UPI000366E5D1|nr:hypothetical protein [Calidithermus timidus]